MISLKSISKIFSGVLGNAPVAFDSGDKLSALVKMNMETNLKLWNLEDSARMTEFGPEHVAGAKQEIDKNNQVRNDLIREIDTEVSNQIRILPPNAGEKFYSESPGMIIDRLAILHIKLSVIRDLLSVIKEDGLKDEYKDKENIILRQIDHIGHFLDSYFNKLEHKEVFFEIQQPVKIYNDKRIKKYIKLLKRRS